MNCGQRLPMVRFATIHIYNNYYDIYGKLYVSGNSKNDTINFISGNYSEIKGKDGDILIDTGFICMKRAIKRWLNNFNIKLIILTHAHVDHIWNASYIKKMYNLLFDNMIQN